MSNLDQRRINNQQTDYVSAREASALLDVKPATLYSYVSRGLLRSVPGPKGRPRRYSREDLTKLAARRNARRGHQAVAAAAMRWGDPVLDSAITEIRQSGPHYRGHSAMGLAQEGHSYEAVCEMLWTGRPLGPAGQPLADQARQTPAGFGRLSALLPDSSSPLSALVAWVPVLAARDPDRFVATEAAELLRARGLIRSMAAVLGLKHGTGAASSRHAGRVAQIALASLGGRATAGATRAAAALDQALIVTADHELNVSTFAARVTASAGADLYACVTAGLAAVSGLQHGGVCDRIEALIVECGRPQRAKQVVRERARRGEPFVLPSHPLYPDGDPRGAYLLDVAAELAPRNGRVATCQALSKAMQDSGYVGPSLDMGLVAISLALGLPPGSATGLFGLGRTAGWIAHTFEQRREGELLRPRARYTGPASTGGA